MEEPILQNINILSIFFILHGRVLQGYSKLTLTQHANSIIGLVSGKIKTLSYLRKYVKFETGLSIYKSMILSLFEYANLTYSLIPIKIRRKMQRLQDRTLRIIYYLEQNLTISELHKSAKLMALDQRAEFQLLCLMFRRSYNHDRYPLVSSERMKKSSFIYRDPQMRNLSPFPYIKGQIYGTNFLLMPRIWINTWHSKRGQGNFWRIRGTTRLRMCSIR